MSDIGLKPILMTKDQIPNSVLKMYLAIVQQIAKIIVADVGNWDYHVIFILDAQSPCNFVSCNNSPNLFKAFNNDS